MRRLAIFLSAVALVCSTVHSSVWADTIHLKNGSVLKGKVTSFADDQFTVMIDTGSGRFLSRATVYVGDVARVEFDATAGGTNESAESTPPAATDTNVAKAVEEPKPTETKTPDRPPAKTDS